MLTDQLWSYPIDFIDADCVFVKISIVWEEPPLCNTIVHPSVYSVAPTNPTERRAEPSMSLKVKLKTVFGSSRSRKMSLCGRQLLFQCFRYKLNQHVN